MERRASRLIGGCVLLALATASCSPPPPAGNGADSAEYVGSAACASCHTTEHQAWQASQHAMAIQEANQQTVLGQFDGRRFTSEGVTTRFFQREGKYWVNTEGPDGGLHDYEVSYTFGVYPLQQYLIPFPGGRYQALGIAWDSRPDSLGGQRWFQLYPGQRLRPGNPLHWTGIDQTWNYQCAECHSTNLRKGYDPATATYRTTWSELVVGCEACHGPGSAHLSWAERDGGEEGRGRTRTGERPGLGLVTRLGDSIASVWMVDPVTGMPRRRAPRTSHAELETCARCHARRGVLSEDYRPGRALAQTHRPALLEAGLYEADGQMRDEVYTYGSFVQSRMYRAGVTCSDCHDPHGARLPTDTTCARCHLPARFASPTHHHHREESTGASCIACHMPTRTYMVIDPRHDHGFKVPRPDLSDSLGIPNACTDCHQSRPAAWAARAAASWYPGLGGRASTAALALSQGRQGLPTARLLLDRLVEDTTQPAIVRATALGLRAGYGGTTLPSPIQVALWDRDPLLRTAGLDALEQIEPRQAVQMGQPLLVDSILLVRITAARVLAGHTALMEAATRPRLDSALAEYRAAEMLSADRPESHLNLGNLAVAMADPATAEREYRLALGIDSSMVAGYVNLADLYRATGRDAQGEPLLRRAVQRAPDNGAAHQALGLLLFRLGQPDAALESLGRAATLAPDNPRFALVYGVALHDLRDAGLARATLAKALERHPHNRELLMTLAAYSEEGRDYAAALAYARRAAALDPADREARGLVARFEALSR